MRFGLGSKLLSWLGLVVAVAGSIADATGVGPAGDIAGHIAMIGGAILAAFGGSVARPRNQRAADPET